MENNIVVKIKKETTKESPNPLVVWKSIKFYTSKHYQL